MADDNSSNDGVSIYAFAPDTVVILDREQTDLKRLARQRAVERGCICSKKQLKITVWLQVGAVCHRFEHGNKRCPLRR